MNLIDNLRRMITPVSNEDEDYDLDFEEQDSPFLDDRPRSYDRSAVDSRRGKVVNIHATTQLKVVLVSGVAYAGEGKIKKVAANTYLITPYSVDIQGDLIDELETNGLYSFN